MPARMLRRLALAGLAVASVTAVAASAQTPAEKPAKPARQCFAASRVSGFSTVDDQHINLVVDPRQTWQASFLGRCPNLERNFSIAVKTRNGSDFVCTGMDADIIVLDRSQPQRCQVTGFRKLTPEEAKASSSQR